MTDPLCAAVRIPFIGTHFLWVNSNGSNYFLQGISIYWHAFAANGDRQGRHQAIAITPVTKKFREHLGRVFG
ncbi:hypothetical protein [Biostraticola tofi]|uniref:hypothetical protein n=1 Tax=Biostraticola tofi TaxID=466109 RepID=UPI0010458249|nr:hypothetical protein [Biostraticola tofi]